MDAPVPGQRWISVAEPSLGLGLVVQVARRQVQVLFAGGGETRTYAPESAPLKRVQFSAGDSVEGHSGESFVVETVEDCDGVLTYVGHGRRLPESSLADHLSVEGPESRLLAGHVDSTAWFDLRLASQYHRHRIHRSALRGFTGARIELLPHQLYIAQEVSRRQFPRVLLADEVGLGKTIEACLILHRMVVCGKAQRVLILLPDALVHQWFVELLRRFNLRFRILDQDRYDAECTSGSGNPFLEEQFVLCALPFLAESPKHTQQALAAGWDMLIVDEAHHLRWSPESSSVEYRLVEQIAQVTRGLMLLTASPEQTGPESHFARLRLLDPNRYPCLDRFIDEHAEYGAIAKQAETVIATGDESALQAMLDRHGPGRVMFRNTRAAISGFMKRIPHICPLEAISGTSESPKVLWLEQLLRSYDGQKMLVICDTVAEVRSLEAALKKRMGIDIANFHEALPLLQCDRQAAWFAEPDGPQVLITSGIGGEGRNYQFASHLVLMDVPRDPELIEQRIGRLDRIGQEHDIHIHVPYLRAGPQEGLVRWLHEGLDAFSRPLVGGFAMRNKFGAKLRAVTDALIAETRAEHTALCRRIEVGRDLLLELNSCRPAIAERLVADIKVAEEDATLENYMLSVFEQFGVDAEPLDANDYLLSADHLFCDEFPLPHKHDSMRITYNRRHALSRPTITLLSWDHPMVQGAMDLILSRELGGCSVARSAAFDGVRLRAVYLVEVVSSQSLEIERFLPPTPIVVTVDPSGRLDDEAVSVSGDGEPWWVTDNEPLKRELIPEMFISARKEADRMVPEILSQAESDLKACLGAEIARLRELQAINDHVRPEEIESAEAQLSLFASEIKSARIRLDAVQLIVGKA